MIIKKAEFVTSLAKLNNFVDFDLPEIAFVGRSNVGKSSLINALTDRNKLAKTGSMPGRTRLVNYFLVNDRFMLVDLPGYGYALASKQAQQEWQTLISGYLQKSTKLKMVFVLVDIRITPSELDKQMLEYLYFYNIPFKVIATKMDKVAKSKVQAQVQMLASELGLGVADIIPVSASAKLNIGAVLDFMDGVLDYSNLCEKRELINKFREQVATKNENKKSINERQVKTKKNSLKPKVSQKNKNTNKKNKTAFQTNLATKKQAVQDKKHKKDDNNLSGTKVKHTPRYALKKRKNKK